MSKTIVEIFGEKLMCLTDEVRDEHAVLIAWAMSELASLDLSLPLCGDGYWTVDELRKDNEDDEHQEELLIGKLAAEAFEAAGGRWVRSW